MSSSSTPKNGVAQSENTKIDSLASEFKAKVKIPIKAVPLVGYNNMMKEKVREFHRYSFMIKALEGKLSIGTLRQQLEQVWDPIKPKNVQMVKDTKEVFQVWLENQAQMEWIMVNQPWIVSGHILRMIPWSEYQEGNIDFSKYFIWFHLLNFPEIYYDHSIIVANLYDSEFFDEGKNLVVMEMFKKSGANPQIIRVEACMDVDDPIPPGMNVPISAHEVQSVQFGYECIPNVCFKCGFICHVQAKCEKEIIREEKQATERQDMYNPRIKIAEAKLEGRLGEVHYFLHNGRFFQWILKQNSGVENTESTQRLSQVPTYLLPAMQLEGCQVVVCQGNEPRILDISTPVTHMFQSGHVSELGWNIGGAVITSLGSQNMAQMEKSSLQEQFYAAANPRHERVEQGLGEAIFTTAIATMTAKQGEMSGNQDQPKNDSGANQLMLDPNANYFKRPIISNAEKLSEMNMERNQMQEEWANVLFEEREPRRKVQMLGAKDADTSKQVTGRTKAGKRGKGVVVAGRNQPQQAP